MNMILITLGIYIFSLLLLAVWTSIGESARGYFLNNKKTGLATFTFSTFGSMIGAGATVAIVAEVYETGISYGLALPISMVIGCVVLAFLAPKIKQLGDELNAFSIVDVFKKKTDNRTGKLMLIVQLATLAVNIATQAAAFIALISVVAGVPFWVAFLLSAGLTIIYSSLGGLKMDLISDTIQFWIVLIIFIATIFYLNGDIGGFDQIANKLPAGHLDPFAFGGVGWFVGICLFSPLMFIGIPTNWQRIFSARSQYIAKKGYLVNAFLIIFFSFLIIYLGLAGAILLPGIADKSFAIFEVLEYALPTALTGAGFAAILAVIMSSVDSMLVAGSTILWRAFGLGKTNNEKKKVRLARVTSFIFGIISFSLILLIPDIINLSMLTASLMIVLSIPTIKLLFSQNFSAKACFWSLLVGSMTVLVVFPIAPKFAFLPAGIMTLILVLLPAKIWGVK